MKTLITSAVSELCCACLVKPAGKMGYIRWLHNLGLNERGAL
jgi:hypothetical protein